MSVDIPEVLTIAGSSIDIHGLPEPVVQAIRQFQGRVSDIEAKGMGYSPKPDFSLFLDLFRTVRVNDEGEVIATASIREIPTTLELTIVGDEVRMLTGRGVAPFSGIAPELHSVLVAKIRTLIDNK